MESYRKLAFTEEVESILAENNKRLKNIFGTHDQFTGRGMEGHSHRVVIDDYPIRVQWLTEEVFKNDLYQDVLKAGSIKDYTIRFNELYPDSDGINEEDVANMLFWARCSRDPSFAFFSLFKIKSKEAVQLYMAWIQLFVMEGWYSVIIAQTKDTAKRIKAMYKKVLDNIPGFIYSVDKLQFAPYEHSASDSIITDPSGNKVRDNVITVASYENFESTRGMDYAMAHFSEVAYWKTTDGKSAEQVITNIDSNILERPLTMEISESTANGMAGYFYDEYQMAKEGTSSRKALFIPFFFIENDMIRFKDKKETRLFILDLLEGRGVTTSPNDNSEPGQYLWSLWEKGATLEHIKWYIKKRASFHDHASMASEAPSDDVECFKYSGNLVFNIYTIEVMRERYVSPPEFIGDISQSEKTKRIILTKNPNGLLRIWKRPDDTRTSNEYLVIVDVGGRSKNSDPSCITVINRWNLRFSGGKPEVVARWHGHIRYDWLAYKAVKIARYYKNALLAFESNTFDKKKSEASEFVEEGDHIRGILKKIEDIYPNLYMRAATDPEDIRNGIYKKIGFQTNKKTKQDMVDNFIVAFEDDMFIDPDERMYKEASKYEQRPDGSYGNIPGRGNHDDILMTDMIGALISEDMPKPSIIKEESTGYLDSYPKNESSL